MHTNSTIARPLWFKATHGLVVCLVLLASVRSLVPGLCATLASAKERTAKTEALPPCCAERLAREEAAPAWRAPVPTRENVPCAFCHLVLGLGHASPAAPVVLTVDTPELNLPEALPAPYRAAVLAGTPSRAPPALA